jgi:sugar lactone lactonase YvrE
LDAVNERNWDVVAEGIWFMEARRGQGATLRFLRFADGKITELTKTPLPTVNGISVSPDGLTVLYTQLDHTGTELMLIENFR